MSLMSSPHEQPHTSITHPHNRAAPATTPPSCDLYHIMTLQAAMHITHTYHQFNIGCTLNINMKHTMCSNDPPIGPQLQLLHHIIQAHQVEHVQAHGVCKILGRWVCCVCVVCGRGCVRRACVHGMARLRAGSTASRGSGSMGQPHTHACASCPGQ